MKIFAKYIHLGLFADLSIEIIYLGIIGFFSKSYVSDHSGSFDMHFKYDKKNICRCP